MTALRFGSGLEKCNGKSLELPCAHAHAIDVDDIVASASHLPLPHGINTRGVSLHPIAPQRPHRKQHTGKVAAAKEYQQELKAKARDAITELSDLIFDCEEGVPPQDMRG